MDEEYGLNRMGENDDDDAEGNSTAPPTPTPPAAMPEEIVEEEAPVEMVPEQKPLWCMRRSWQMQSQSCRTPPLQHDHEGL
jgi:hypothetical protein